MTCLIAAPGAARKRDLLLRGLHAIRVQHGRGPIRQSWLAISRLIDRRQRAVEQRCDVGIAAAAARRLLCHDALRKVVRPGSLPFVGRDVELAAGRRRNKRHRHRHPFRRHKSDRLDHSRLRRLRRQFARVDHRDRIGGHVRHIQPAAIGVDGERNRLGAEVALPRQARIEVALHGELSRAHIHGRNRVAIGQRHVERLLVGRESQRAGMRSRSDGARRLEQR